MGIQLLHGAKGSNYCGGLFQAGGIVFHDAGAPNEIGDLKAAEESSGASSGEGVAWASGEVAQHRGGMRAE